MKKMLSASVLLFFSVNAFSYFDGGLNFTTGSNNYSGTSVYAIVGSGNFWLEPSLNIYESDYTLTTFRNYEIKAGMDSGVYAACAAVGMVPEKDEYKNVYVKGDITFTLTSGGHRKGRLAGPQMFRGSSKGDGLTRIDVGAGFKYIKHEDNYNILRQKLSSPCEIKQTDISLFAGIKFFSLVLSGDYTASSYDKTLNMSIRPFQYIELPGVITRVQAYPKSSLNLTATLPGLPFVSPYASYGKTKFELSSSELKTYTFGAFVDFAMLKVNAAYQIQDLTDTDNYVTLGASIAF